MTAEARKFDCVVLGAGAAGLMAASTAGRRGRRIALLEHNGQPGRKILISGGGRCNFTNLHCRPENFISQNPHFPKSALALYQPRHFLELVETYGIRWHEKTLGQLFCDASARAILDMLLAECAAAGVEIILNARDIAVERASGGFHLESSQGSFWAESLVVATGGLSIPKLGATGLGYELARQFGLKVVEPRPALVPLLLGGHEAAWTLMAGLSAEVEASVGRARFREKMLITHRGLSGPAILQASSYWQPGAELVLDFGLANSEPLAALREPAARRDLAAVKQALRAGLPQRLADHLAETGGPKGFSNAALTDFEGRLRAWRMHPVATEGFEKAEVTAGGVDTACLHARTMEARTVPGLFVIGEVVDVTGQLGGFNFQWAWASGFCAGQAV